MGDLGRFMVSSTGDRDGHSTGLWGFTQSWKNELGESTQKRNHRANR